MGYVLSYETFEDMVQIAFKNILKCKFKNCGDKNMVIKEENYPMTYEEYEKRIIDLFLQAYPEDKQETLIKRLDNLLEDDPNFIDGLYGETCFRYDRADLYGENCKKVFEDPLLESIPVNTLHQILGGSLD